MTIAEPAVADSATRTAYRTCPLCEASVVSIPHGWGHDLDGVQLSVAGAHAGLNSNLLADETLFDPISGNAVLNGIPVTVERAGGPSAHRRLSAGLRGCWREQRGGWWHPAAGAPGP